MTSNIHLNQFNLPERAAFLKALGIEIECPQHSFVPFHWPPPKVIEHH